MKGIKTNIILLLVTLVGFLITAEIVIRTRDAFKGYNFFSNDHRDKLIIKKKPIIPFRTFGPKFYFYKGNEIFISSSHNELYPLKKGDNTFRIVCIGGSTTEDRWNKENNGIHYPLLLQNHLREEYPDKNIEVINAGAGAYATPHMLILLELDVISWEPDLLIIFENHNDLTAYIYSDFTFDYSNKYGAKRYLSQSYLDDYTTLNALFRWSSFYWYIKEKWDILFNKQEIYSRKYKSFGNDVPELNKQIFKRNLLNMYYIANHWNIKTLFATQAYNPVGYNPSDYIPSPKEEIWPLKDEFENHHIIFNNIIKEVADTTDSYFVDSHALLSDNSENFIDDLHYSKQGTKKLAAAFFNYIVSENIINNY